MIMRLNRFRSWRLTGGTVSAVLLMVVPSGIFGLVNANTTAFMVVFIMTFLVPDVFYSLRDISYWDMVPAITTDSHERGIYTARTYAFDNVATCGVMVHLCKYVPNNTAPFSITGVIPIVAGIEANLHSADGSAKYGKAIAKAALLGKDVNGLAA
ncbi:MFS transporter [Bifidobacterium sp. MA2]|uniref:MFS transporter n=1 Tax=Bifidobacterium santillanense TaxID=2809028 RepID=A0ABS5UNW7_9BIFI|nr:MFS transporter [Bifidobacterium santillanense]